MCVGAPVERNQHRACTNSAVRLGGLGLAFVLCFVLCRCAGHRAGAARRAGRWNIRRLKTQADMKKLIGLDPFHSFLNQSTFKIILRIVTVVS